MSSQLLPSSFGFIDVNINEKMMEIRTD